jgi:hypothetical protein
MANEKTDFFVKSRKSLARKPPVTLMRSRW